MCRESIRSCAKCNFTEEARSRRLLLRPHSIEEVIDQSRFIQVRQIKRQVFFDFAADIGWNILDDLLIDLLRRGKEAALYLFWFKQGGQTLGHLTDQPAAFLQMHVVLLAVRAGASQFRIAAAVGGTSFKDRESVSDT